MTRTQEFIKKYHKVLESGPDFYNPDTSLMQPEEYETAKCRILLILPTPHVVKTVSSTVAAINDFIITHCPGTFLDVAYMPENVDIKLYDAHNMPYAIGNITHLDASHFDIVGFSISVLNEVVTAPVILSTFSRCDKPIPLFWTQRKDLPLGECPVIYAGGITAVCGECMFGKVTVNGKVEQGYVDFMYLGDCGQTNLLTNRYIEARQTGKCTRKQEDHDVPGYLHEEIPNFEEVCTINTIQDYVESLFDLQEIYQPQAYDVEYNSNNMIVKNIKINPKARNYVTPFYPHIMEKDLGIGRAVINANGDNCGTTQTQVSEGCSAGGCCSFCAEGNYTGGWVEKDEEQIMSELREAKKYSAGYKYKPYSFNANYVRDYKGKLAKFIRVYPKVTFINMRMEELGRDPDALKMMKLIGSNRISAPMEGLSPRIQNNLLNKCLSAESLQNFMDEMVHAKMTDIKVGGIFTGYETDEDFQWICDFVDSFKKRAAKEGGNFPFRLKCTPLVHYPLTPIEYLERKSARASYNGEHWLTDEWYEKFREHQVFFKVNGFRYSTFLEQTFVDLGRSLTPLLHKHFISTQAPIYSLRSCATEGYLEDLRKMVNVNTYFEDRDPEHYISPSHRIHIELMGSYIPRARRLLRCKRAGNIFANEPDLRCLKTFDGAKVRCYHSCIVKDPLKMYYDVTMDEEGNLHGEKYDLTGCQRCPTKERRKERLAREIVQTKNSDDIMMTPRIPQVQKIRFVIRRLPEYDCLNPDNTAHTFLTKFLQLSENLLDGYHSVQGHSMFWQKCPGFKYFTAGFQIVDTMWSKNVYKEVVSLIPEVNKQLKSVQVVSAEEIVRDEKVVLSDYNIYTFESTIPRETFIEAAHTYKGNIKVEAPVQGFALTEIEDHSLKAPVFMSKGGKTIGTFWIPAKYNPEMYLSGYLSCGKKTSEQGVVDTTQFNCVMCVRDTKAAARDGKEKATVSLITGKPVPFGKNSLCRAILSQISK